MNPFLAGQLAARGQTPAPQERPTTLQDILQLRQVIAAQEQAAQAQAAEQAAMAQAAADAPPELRALLRTREGFNEWAKSRFSAPAGPLSTIGKLVADRDAGRISPEEFASEMEARAKQGQTNISLAPPGVTIDMLGEKQVDEVQTFYGGLFAEIQKSGLKAPEGLARIDRLEQLLDQVQTGALAPTALVFKRGLQSIGIDPEALGLRDDVGPAEAANALSAQMALELRDPSTGAGMPGAMSDADRAFLASMIPNLQTTPEGRKLMFNMMRGMNKRRVQIADMARKYVSENGSIDSGFFDQVQKFSDANPLAPPVLTPEQAKEVSPGTIFITTDGRVMTR